VLTSPSEIVVKALGQLTGSVSDATKQLGQRLFIARGASSFNARRPALQTLGNIFYAREIGGVEAGDLQLYAETFKTLDALTIDSIESLKVDPALFPKAVATPPSTASPTRGTASVTRAPATTTRAAMLKDAMTAVVLVTAGDKSGSGFFVGSTGLLLTNAHVVEGSSRIAIHTTSGESFLATPVRISTERDLALLKVSVTPQIALRLGSSSSVSVGTDVVAIGNPLGLQGTVTKGIVSAIRKFDGMTFLQIDAAINAGNSGGPLLTEAGEVIGINTWKVKAEGVELLGFAIAIDDAKTVFKDYLR
jgi:S1-C subfamily serine protease